MVFFNYSTMQMAAKVVYYGPGLCGKTTNLQWIFDHTSNDSRGEMVSLATETDRTLFFDLLPIDVGTIAGFNTRIQLYTVPGQVFYNTTRKLVLKGVDGVVFVADSQRAMLQANIDSLDNLEENLNEMGLTLAEIPVVLQFNKRDLPNVMAPEELNEALNRHEWGWANASAITGDGVFETLKMISKATLLALKKRLTKGRTEGAGPGRPAAAPGARPLPKAPVKPPLPPRPGPKPAPPPGAAAKPPLPRPAPPKPLPAKPPAPETPSPPPEEKSAPEPASEETKAPAPEETKAPAPEETKAPVPEESKAPVPEESKAPVPEETKAPVPEETKAPVPEETKAPESAAATAAEVDLPALEPLEEFEPVEVEPPEAEAEPVEAEPALEETGAAVPEPDEDTAAEPPVAVEPMEAVPVEAEPMEEESQADEPVEAEPVEAEPVEAEPTAVEALDETGGASAEAPPAPAEKPPAPAIQPPPPRPAAPRPAAPPSPAVAPPEPSSPPPSSPAVPSPSSAAPSPPPEAAPRRRKPRLGGIDALAELEKLRRQALHPKATARKPEKAVRQEIRRQLELALGRADLERLRHLRLNLHLVDESGQELGEPKDLEIDLRPDTTARDIHLSLSLDVDLAGREE